MTIDFSQFENTSSKFVAVLAKRGGYITFSNSGKGGDRKFFTLSLDSFLQILKDISSNLNAFHGHEEYVEREWRDLGSRFYQDPAANAMCTVQTKPMFVTLSKIIMWANDINLGILDPEQRISLTLNHINGAILKVENLASSFAPAEIKQTEKKVALENEVVSDKSIREFALKVFSHYYNDAWKEVINQCELKDSKINDQEFKSLDFLVFKRLLGEFEQLQTKEELKSANTIRYFEKPVYSEGNKYYYFSTQWNGTGNYDLTFQNLKEYFEANFACKIIKIGKEFKLIIVEEDNSNPFDSDSFYKDLIQSNLKFEKAFSTRLIASLCTKPFLILTGLTGSGKTKLAQSFAYWLSGTADQYEIVPVGADWTNREPLLGYPDGLNQEMYIHPDSKVLELIMRAEESDLPHFIVLDEMNLSHVERYFADFLSIMESGESAKLYTGANRKDGFGRNVPQQISWSKNLYIIGTVNIDESTYMFSPKVLDRANVIEFRVTELEMETFLKSDPVIDLSKLKSKGASMGLDFVSISSIQSNEPLSDANQIELLKFFRELKKLGAEYGYRSASEISSLLHNLNKVDSALSMEEKLDIAIMQKILPKLHGSRSKLLPVLEKLGKLCLSDESKWDGYLQNKDEIDYKAETKIIYKLSFEKIIRMYRNAMDNGFASYAEA